MTIFDSRTVVTPTETKVYQAVINHITKKGCSPTYFELEKKLRRTRNAIRQSLISLQQKGYIRRTNRWRGIDILKKLK